MTGTTRLATALVLAATAGGAAAQEVAVITPYLAQPGTQFYVDGFTARAGELGWQVNVIDTAGDVAAVISRIEDVVVQGVDAIVINVDPAQVGAGLQAAADAGIPVVGMDAGSDPLVQANITSNGYAMAAETAVYVANRIGGEGNVVMFTFDPFPPVQVRGAIADAVFGNFPDITVIDRITPDVSDGGIADSRARMEASPRRQSRAGQHRGGLGRVGPARAGRLAGHRGRRARGRGDRDHGDRRQSAGAGCHRAGRQLRGLRRAGLRGDRPDHGRHGRAHSGGRAGRAAGDLCADPSHHRRQRDRRVRPARAAGETRPSHVLDLQGIGRRFGAVRALEDVSLSLRSGEVHALMGENGAGKSTLIRILAGLDSPDAGRIALDGAALASGSPATMRAAGLRFIHQELHPVPGLSVAENMVLDHPYPRRFGLVDWRALHRIAGAALARLGLGRLDPRAPMSTLGAGDQMLVRIASSLIGGGAWAYVMDEPTAALTTGESDQLFRVIDELLAQGAAVLYVSHRMGEVMRLAHRVTVLRDGRHISTKLKDETDEVRVIADMTGRTLEGLFPPRTRPHGDAVVLHAGGCRPRACGRRRSSCARARSSGWPGSRARGAGRSCARYWGTGPAPGR
jgi:ABC-type branched-subunit amino acid transport system ATPase component